MKYCTRCILPDSRPGLKLDADGVCNACRGGDQKRSDIDWAARERRFQEVVANAKARAGHGYDCLVPVSGGKDSTWQVIKCLEAGLRVLAVTWRPPGRTELGQKNLDNLIRLGVDHIDYSIDPRVEKRFMWKTFEKLGSPAVPMHLALFGIPLSIAVRFQVPLVIWGENSAFEYGGDAEQSTGFELNAAWLKKHGVTGGTTHRDWVGGGLSDKDLHPYSIPEDQALERAGVRAVFLGYYFPWDPLVTARVAQEHGFTARAEGPRTGLYGFADIDDEFISVHHWIKWYKFGFTRLFDNLSIEIRAGRLTRAQAVAMVRERGDQTPAADIESFARFVGQPIERVYEVARSFRNASLWKKTADHWELPGFLIEDWPWRRTDGITS